MGAMHGQLMHAMFISISYQLCCSVSQCTGYWKHASLHVFIIMLFYTTFLTIIHSDKNPAAQKYVSF